VSIVLWLSAISVPFGGMLADRTGRPGLVLVGGTLAGAVLLLAAAHGAPVVPTFILLGLICGLPAGAIMGLPLSVLPPESRAFGMGVYYAVYYLVMMAGPVCAGIYASWTGSPGAPFEFGAAALAACPLLLGVFGWIAASARRPAPA
jgi:MFS family permease